MSRQLCRNFNNNEKKLESIYIEKNNNKFYLFSRNKEIKYYKVFILKKVIINCVYF